MVLLSSCGPKGPLLTFEPQSDWPSAVAASLLAPQVEGARPTEHVTALRAFVASRPAITLAVADGALNGKAWRSVDRRSLCAAALQDMEPMSPAELEAAARLRKSGQGGPAALGLPGPTPPPGQGSRVMQILMTTTSAATLSEDRLLASRESCRMKFPDLVQG